MKLKIFYISFFIIILDQLTKVYFKSESYNFGILSLHFVKNYGAGFGILQGQKILLIAISIFAIALILYYLKGIKKEDVLFYGLTFLLAGAIGNLIDRLFLSYVIDFIDLKFFPAVFNVADVSNTMGALLIFISLFKKRGS